MTRSYLKWVGSKQQLAHTIIGLKPTDFDLYVEPFCGSAAIFFNLFDSEHNDMFGTCRQAVLGDMNRLLVNCHQVVATRLEELMPLLKQYEANHTADPATFYKAQGTRVKELKLPDAVVDVDAAALFVYLNKAGFNGLWRLNRQGGFNTPWNQKTHINLASRHIEECSMLLSRYATIHYQPFESTIEQTLGPNTFYLLDPPYIPLSATASFVSYTENGWGHEHDLRLRDSMEAIDRAGGKFLMTNSSAPAVKEIFGRWKIVEVQATRMIKASSDRPTVNESIVTNY